MAISVSPNTVHPAAGFSKEPDPRNPFFFAYVGTRVFTVTGLDDGSSQAGTTALSRVLSAPGLPRIGTPAPGEPGLYGCIAVKYDTQVVPQSDDAVYILVRYDTPRAGTPFFWVVSLETRLENRTTELVPGTYEQIRIQWSGSSSVAVKTVQVNIAGGLAPPLSEGNYSSAGSTILNKIDEQAAVPYGQPVLRLVIAGAVAWEDYDPIAATVGTVNSKNWARADRGFWRFDDFGQEVLLGNQLVNIRCGFSNRIAENWMEWVVARNLQLGKRITLDPEVIQSMRDQEYVYGQVPLNGATGVGPYKTADFANIFKINGNTFASMQSKPPDSAGTPTNIGG